MLVRCPARCQALGGWPRNSGYGHFFFCPGLWHKVVSPGGLGSKLRGVVPLGSWKAALCRGSQKLVIGGQEAARPHWRVNYREGLWPAADLPSPPQIAAHIPL